MTCSDCGGGISRRSLGRCRACAARQTGRLATTREKIAAAMKRKWASDPAYRAHQTAHLLRVMPSAEAKRARIDGRSFSQTGHAARWARHQPGSAERALTGRRISAAKLAHIPGDYRAEYRRLVKSGWTAAEAEAMVRATAEADRVRIVRELSA